MIRWSSDEAGFGTAVTIFRKPEGDVIDEGHVCPAQTGKTECCGTCGLCWSPAMRDESIAFVAHGNPGRKKAASRPKETARDRIWKAYAELISETGLSPKAGDVAERADCSAQMVYVTLPSLLEKGCLEKTGERRGTKYRVLKWPDGVEPREPEDWPQPVPVVSEAERLEKRRNDLAETVDQEQREETRAVNPKRPSYNFGATTKKKTEPQKPRNVFDNAVFTDTDKPGLLTKTQKSLLEHMGRSGTGWVSWNIHTLERELGIASNDISYARSELVRKGYIEGTGIPDDSMFRILMNDEGVAA